MGFSSQQYQLINQIRFDEPADDLGVTKIEIVDDLEIAEIAYWTSFDTYYFSDDADDVAIMCGS